MNLLDLFESDYARDKWNRASAEREAAANKREAEMKARHQQGKEDMSGAIDRLEKHLNTPVNEGSMKDWLWKQAELLSKDQFVDNAGEYGMTPEEAAEWWDDINGVELDEKLKGLPSKPLGTARDLGKSVKKFRAQRGLDEAGIGQDIVNKQEKMARATPQTKAGAVASTVKNAAKWLAGKGGPGKEGPTYEGQKKNSKEVEEYKLHDLSAQAMLKKARATHPIAKDDAEALALYIADKEQRDVDRLERENEQEEAMIARIIDQLKSKEVEEGWQDFKKVEPYAVCLAGKPVKKFDYYEEARRFHDNWKQKLYREGNKEKADKITLMPILDELDVSTLKSYADKRGAQVAAMKADNPDPVPGSKEWVKAAIPAQQVARAKQKIARAERQQGVAEAEDQVDPIILKALERLQPGLEGSQLYSAAKEALALEFGLMKARGDATFIHYLNQLQNIYSQRHSVKEDMGSWIVYDPETKQIRKRFKTHTAGKSYAKTHGLGFASSEYYFDNIKPAVTAEGMTDYQKRRQRERDIDAGRPVARQRPSKQTDYQKRRAEQKRQDELGEDQLDEKWSEKYKRSINCSNPKGFSQRAHCAGRKKNEDIYMENNEARDAVESAIIRRILVAHKDLLQKFGPQKVMDAAAAIADDHADVEEIGTSDVSAYVHEVERYLAMNY